MTEVQEPHNQTALDVFNASFNDLQARMANNEVNLQTANQQLGRILKFAEKNNLEKIAQSARETWQHTLSLYEGNQQAFAALQGAQVAIEHVEQQRRAIANEYDSLMKAISEDDDSHPALMDFSLSIREAALEEAEEDMYYGMEEMVADATYDGICEDIAAAWGNGIPPYRILEAVRGADYPPLTDEQKALFRAFLETLK